MGNIDVNPVTDFSGGTPPTADPVLRPTYVYTSAYPGRFENTWCLRCGRRRGADGHCPDCDGWWTAPVYLYGGGLVAAVTTLLLIFVPLLRPHSFSARVIEGTPVTLGRPMVSGPAMSVSLDATPVFVSVPAALPPVLTPEPPAPQVGDGGRLREATDFAASVQQTYEVRQALDGSRRFATEHVAGAGVRIPVGPPLPTPPPARPVTDPGAERDSTNARIL